MAILKTDQMNIEGKQFVVNYISQAIPNNTATTLTMQARALANGDIINPVGVVMQNVGLQGVDYLGVPFTYTVTGGKVVVTLNYASGAGNHVCRFAIFYKK